MTTFNRVFVMGNLGADPGMDSTEQRGRIKRARGSSKAERRAQLERELNELIDSAPRERLQEVLRRTALPCSDNSVLFYKSIFERVIASEQRSAAARTSMPAPAVHSTDVADRSASAAEPPTDASLAVESDADIPF